MKVLCITIGSAGDVHPFIGIGLELARRGHDVYVVTNDHFQKLIESVGLKFIELGKAEWYAEGIRNPKLWHRRHGFQTVLEWGVLPLVRPTYDIIARESAAGGTIVVASSLALGARVAQDKLGVPTVTVHLAPSVFLSLIDTPVLPGVFMPKWLPTGVKRAMFKFANRRVIDPILGPTINPFLVELGLPEEQSFFGQWWHSPTRVLGLFPSWFARPAADWPEQVRLTGFPLYDEAGVSDMDERVTKFLDEGAPPIAFTAGTAMLHGQRFFAASVAAASKLGRRAVLLTRHPEQLPQNLPAGMLHIAYAPFSALLPRCAALVHHGGIGTTAQALQAGIPQLIYPMAHDQPDNAARVKRLGLGDSIHPFFYRKKAVAKKLDRLLNDPAVRANCIKVKMRFIGIDPMKKTCDEIENIASSIRTEGSETKI